MRKIHDIAEFCLLLDNDYLKIYEAIHEGKLTLSHEEIKALRNKKTIGHSKHDDFRAEEVAPSKSPPKGETY